MKYLLFFSLLTMTFIFSYILALRIFHNSIITDLSRSREISMDFENTISVFPQKVSQDLIISSITNSKSGFIVIKEKTANVSQNIFAVSSILPPGKSTNIRIHLPNNTKPGNIYIAELHHDNGNKVFDDQKIDPIVMLDKNTSSRIFYIN